MLKSVRIEVEEGTAERCVESLWKYEHAIQVAEAQRFAGGWPIELSSERELGTPEEQYGIRFHPWSDDRIPRSFFNEQLGRELVEEVIEYDQSIPAYRGRRVVRFVRLDMRDPIFVPLEVAEVETFDSIHEHLTTVTPELRAEAAARDQAFGRDE